MSTLDAKYPFLDRERRIYWLAVLFSLLLHLIFFLIWGRDIFNIDLSPDDLALPEEVSVVFPENRPSQIVENINENEQIPDRSDLLSDRNSQARNPQLLDRTGQQPASRGNIPEPNLTRPDQQPDRSALLQRQKKFSRDALLGRPAGAQAYAEADTRRQSAADDPTTDNIFDQKEFSADQVGDLSLSTYAWEWAPYINAMKRKLYSVWFTPPAYHRLGLIHGETVIRFTITRDGRLLSYDVLGHIGHESLETSSVNAIESVFPFRPLPANFPEETLTIIARLIYPNLRERR